MEYICIIDDETQGLQGYEHLETAYSEEEAMFNAQEYFPNGRVTAVHDAEYLEWCDSLRARAERKRAQEKPVKGPLGELIDLVAKQKTL
jgi:hypothetical protein